VANEALAGALNLPFAEQIDFFRKKLNLPTERWDDIWKAAHDRAFIVAGAMKADLLADLRTAVERGKGTTQETFRKAFREIVKKHGWTGWTGEGTISGEAWRTRVIYETNLRTSWAAGRRRQLTDPDLLQARPFWRYVHSGLALEPRPEHKAWSDAGLTLPADHPFWDTHSPPNGWGCRCRIVAVRDPGPDDATAPPPGWDTIDPKTGEPPGIAKGWGYAPGANAATPLAELVEQKLLRLDAPIGAAMWEALAPAIAFEREQSWWRSLDEWLADPLPRGRTAVVGALSPHTLRGLGLQGVPPPAVAAILAEDRLVVGAKQVRHEFVQQNGLMPEEWRAVPQWLDRADVYFQPATGHLLFVSTGVGPSKVAVEFATRGETANRLVSAYRVAATDIAGMVKGGELRIVRVR